MEKIKIDGIPIESYGRPPMGGSSCFNNINFMQLGAMQGWQCPVCKRILAPFVQECPCKGQGVQTVTVATTVATGTADDLKGADNIE